MATMSHQRTYNLMPRPRSTWQIIPLLEIGKGFLDGKNWIEKDLNNKNITQYSLYEALAASEHFELVPGREDEMRGRTYLTMNPMRLGLCWKKANSTNNQQIVFTPVADALIKRENIEQVWLKQMLKWQIPSTSDKQPHMQKNSFHPFLASILVCIHLGVLTKKPEQEYLSKWEYSVFVLTMTNDKHATIIAKDILMVRMKVRNLKKTQKDQYRLAYAIKHLKWIYKDDIKAGRFSKRQQDPNKPKLTIDEEAERRVRQNETDFTDTTMRYMRATGIFVASDRVKRLRLDPRNRWKAIELAKSIELTKINTDYTNVQKFYSWFGNPNEPKLPWESIPGYNQEIFQNLNQIYEILERI